MDHDHPDTANLKYYCLAYLLSASFKDCSVILRMVPTKEGPEPWKKSITVIDLDVKSVDRLHKWEKLDQKIVEAYTGLPEPTHCIDQALGAYILCVGVLIASLSSLQLTVLRM